MSEIEIRIGKRTLTVPEHGDYTARVGGVEIRWRGSHCSIEGHGGYAWAGGATKQDAAARAYKRFVAAFRRDVRMARGKEACARAHFARESVRLRKERDRAIARARANLPKAEKRAAKALAAFGAK